METINTPFVGEIVPVPFKWEYEANMMNNGTQIITIQEMHYPIIYKQQWIDSCTPLSTTNYMLVHAHRLGYFEVSTRICDTIVLKIGTCKL